MKQIERVKQDITLNLLENSEILEHVAYDSHNDDFESQVFFFQKVFASSLVACREHVLRSYW